MFLDDILITGETDHEHLDRLTVVLSRLQEHNVQMNLNKCKFFTDEVKYCGYVIHENTIRKEPAKMNAIKEMPRPRNVHEIRVFIGIINYYNKFIRNLSGIPSPLNQLLHKNEKFVWTEKQKKAFNKAKRAFMSNQILVQFNPKLPLVLATDASPYGVGAVLSHIYPDGTEWVIQYASQTLSETQKKYAQIDKDAYSIMFGVRRFYQYLYGNKFALITDHRPLVQIFSPSKSLPVYSAMKMQHYAIFLQEFNYTIRYRKSEDHGNADCLSRLPLKNKRDGFDVANVFELNMLQTLPIDANSVAVETQKDMELSKLLHALQSGTLAYSADRFNLLLEQAEFTLQSGTILRAQRVIPKILRPKVLEELHTGHFGITKMKGVARNYCW